MERPVRHLLSALAALVVLGAACAPAAAPTTQTTPAVTGGQQAPAPARSANQSLRVAQTAVPPSLSPESSSSNIAFFSTIYDTLVTFKPGFEVVPQIAERWEFLNGNWRFYLRKDVKFTDGTALTADDVVFSVKLIVDKNLPQRAYLPTISDAKAIDPYTVDVISPNPDISVLNGMVWAFVLPKAYYEKLGKDAFQTKAMGSGPYEVAEFAASDHGTFKKKADHPFRKVIATELKFQAVPEIGATATGLRTGDVDVSLQVAFSADQVEALKRDNINIAMMEAVNIHGIFSQPENAARNTPLTDKRVRIALNYAIDREAIAKNLYRGLARPANQISLPSSPMYRPDAPAIPYDPVKAKAMLAEAGYPNGFKLPVGIDFTPSSINPQIITAIQGYLKDVGVEAAVTSYEQAAYLDKFYGRSGQTKGDIWTAQTGDANGAGSSWRGNFGCDKPAESIWWCNQQFNKLFDQAMAEPDVAKRTTLLRQANAALAEDWPILFTVLSNLFIGYGPKIQGVEFTSPLVYRLDNAFRVE